MTTQEFATWMEANIPTFLAILFALSVWASVWKGIALWKAAQKNALVWFVVLLVFNTVGILEILYIFVFSKMEKVKKSPEKKIEPASK